MKGQELSEAYASADVFVMPSETETLGFVVLEAMASGVPVVAVAAGGLTDIVADNKTGGCCMHVGCRILATPACLLVFYGMCRDEEAGAHISCAVHGFDWF